MIEVGRICIKRKGREKGKYCIVVKEIDKNFVLITGPKKLTGIKRRRCNILHLEPTQYFLEIKEEMSDEEILKLFEKENLIKKLELKKL
jgi:large subunit ribosomal protein L14e